MISKRLKDWEIPLLFFLTTIAAYGLLLPQMGFYWDDWPFVFVAKFLGPKDFFPAFAHLRPFLAPIFFVTTSLIPPVPLYWQILALFIRFLAGLLAWVMFNGVWPQHKRQTLATALLFLVFPGYSQHWVALTHINQEWIPFLFYLISFALTVTALRNPDKFKTSTILALIFLTAGVFPTEYFVGIEPLRFLFIWLIVSEEHVHFSEHFRKAFRYWIPYFLIWLANASWLAYFYTIGSYASYDVKVVGKPFSISRIVIEIANTLWKVGFYVWGQILVLIGRSLHTPSSILTVALIVLSFVFFIFYIRKFEAPKETKAFAVSGLVIGMIGILLGRLPSFAAELPLKLQTSNDRFMISMMIGGSLFIVGLIELVIRNALFKSYLFALLIALGIGQQFFNANLFRRDWIKQQEIYAQLAWRMPAIQPGTLLITDQLPIDYESDLSLTAPINWIYQPEFTRSLLPYALVFTEKRLGGTLDSLDPEERVQVYLRTVHFEGSTSQAIVFYMPKTGCLRVLSSKMGDESAYNRQSVFLRKAIPLSNPDLIIPTSDGTAKLPFVAEPKHTWCYYYTRAELARQQNDWKQVIDMYNKAASLGYGTNDPFEMLVFIEAQGMNGNMDTAKKLSDRAMNIDSGIRKGLCQVWKRVTANDPARTENQLQEAQMLNKLQCPR